MEWKQIVLEDGTVLNYEISNTGLVRNMRTGRISKGSIGTDGYLRVHFKVNGKEKLFAIHRLVAITYLENSDNLPQVNHKDQNKLNNHVENLEFCTEQYNTQYSIKNRKKRDKNCKGYRGVSDDGEVIEFFTIKELEQNGFNYKKVMQNINGRNIHYKGYVWSKIW